MSFILDPPALFLLGMFVYYFSKRFRLSKWITLLVGGVIAFGMFMGGSTLLYLDIIDWPLPPTEGPVWMFHTNYTGISKEDVHLSIAVFMLLLYPVWHFLGYIVAIKLDMGSILLPLVSYEQVKSRKPKPATRFIVKRGGSPGQMVRESVNALGGMGGFVKAGDRVLIKPNICGGNPDIPGSFTRIEVVEELVGMIRDLDAEPVIVDSDMIWTKFQPVAEAQGWENWAEREDIQLVNLVEGKKVRFNFGRKSAIGIVPVSRELVEADVIISVATMKTHLLTNVTMGMKNMYGTFPEENKAKYHRLGIENVIYEVNKAFTPSLTIIDGTIGGEAWGPLSCRPVNSGTIIASNDVVAADSVACKLMGYDPLTVEHIRKAHDEGLGEAKVDFDPSSLPVGHEKDGHWEKPDPKVTKFYESLVEYFLLLPSMQNFFDLAADFVLYGGATIPVLRDLTPELEKVFNDILGMILRNGYRGSKWGEGDLEKFKERIK